MQERGSTDNPVSEETVFTNSGVMDLGWLPKSQSEKSRRRRERRGLTKWREKTELRYLISLSQNRFISLQFHKNVASVAPHLQPLPVSSGPIGSLCDWEMYPRYLF